MEISIPVDTSVVSHNIVDNTQTYNKNIKGYYQFGQEMQDANIIYTYSNASFTPEDYLLANEQTYAINKVLFKNGEIVKVSSIGNATVLKQPEEYTAVADTTFTFNTWTKPWSKIQTAIPAGTYNGFTNVVDGVTHQLYRDATSSTGWRYKITRMETIYSWSADLTTAFYAATYYVADSRVAVVVSNITKYSQTGQQIPVPNTTIWNGNDGKRYRCGALFSEDATYKKFKLQIETTSNYTYTYNTEANVYTSLDSNSVISNAYCADTSDCADRWLGKTFVQRGTDLYVRTAVGILETKVVNVPQYATINYLNEFPNFSLVGVVNYLKPFDGKNYTTIKQNALLTPVQYTLSVQDNFDTLAISGLIATEINVVFKNSLGDAVTSVLSYKPDNKRDSDGRLSDYKTTVILYAGEDINGGTVEISLLGSEVNVGTIVAGLSVNAGFTNLEFTNKFSDYSPYEKDQWGNVTYISGVKTNVHTGSVDVPIQRYDLISRLMISIGGSTIILNGSDNKTNRPITGSSSMFSSTMMIGRLNNFSLQTKLKEDDLDRMANYTFSIEENV